MTDVLGDEADIALCENCHVTLDLDDTANVVVCEACSAVFCRKICWSEHWCGPLTDRTGRLVKMGDLMKHHDHYKVYRVTEMAESFRKHALAVGVEVLRKGEGTQRIPLHTRLMEIVDKGGG